MFISKKVSSIGALRTLRLTAVVSDLHKKFVVGLGFIRLACCLGRAARVVKPIESVGVQLQRSSVLRESLDRMVINEKHVSVHLTRRYVDLGATNTVLHIGGGADISESFLVFL